MQHSKTIFIPEMQNYWFKKFKLNKPYLSKSFLAAPQLLTIGILGVVILFGYSVISFIIYSSVFDEQSGLYCITLFECFVSVSRIGLLDTLGQVSLFKAVDIQQLSITPPTLMEIAM